MIISASYKTDIPTFYGRWFMNRLRAGYCKSVNPYNRQQVITVDLRPEAVDGIVFWTKNLGPFVEHLQEVKRLGYAFIVQYTINAYPRTLEFSVVDAAKSIEHMKRLRDAFGPRVGVWRYDTIVFTSATPRDLHVRNFERLARSLEGTTDEVVVSFAQLYRKTLRNMAWAAEEFGFQWEDPPEDAKQQLAVELAQIARASGMTLSMCSQRQFLAPGIADARCVDAPRLADVSGRTFATAKRGNRPDCGCHASRDIGEYDTCPHGCVYCYAVQNRELAQSRFKQHDPEGEFLFPPGDLPADHVGGTDSDEKVQLPLFR